MESCTDPLALMSSFRAAMYAAFSRRADALFELANAVLCRGMAGGLPPI